MPSPLAHTLAGCTAATLAAARHAPSGVRWRWLLLLVLLANLPDLDFLPGLFIGQPEAFHRGASHSAAAALLCGGALGAVGWWRGARVGLWFALGAGAYGSHLVLDFFSPATDASSGLPLLWPLSAERFLSPWPLFLSIEKSGVGAGFLASLLSAHNLVAVVWEAVLLAPVVAAAFFLQRQRAA